MSRTRSVMSLVTGAINSHPEALTSTEIARKTGLEISQTKDALKVLSKLKEVRRMKDPASKRGFLYLPLRPPAYQFVDPSLFSDEVTQDTLESASSIAWMSQRLLQPRMYLPQRPSAFPFVDPSLSSNEAANETHGNVFSVARMRQRLSQAQKNHFSTLDTPRNTAARN